MAEAHFSAVFDLVYKFRCSMSMTAKILEIRSLDTIVVNLRVFGFLELKLVGVISIRIQCANVANHTKIFYTLTISDCLI